MKKGTLIQICSLSLVLCFFSSGCEEGLTGQQIQLFTSQMQQLSSKVDDSQKVMNETIRQFETTGLVSKETIAKVEKVSSEIDKVQEQQEEITKAINNVKYGDDGFLNVIKAAQAGNAASAPYNPYAAPIAGILAIAEAATLAFLKKKSDEATENKNINTKVISSVDSLLTSPLVSDPKKAKELLAEKQGTTVSVAVKKIKGN